MSDHTFSLRTFAGFPQDKLCPLCKTSTDTPCMLLPIDGTSDGSICEAIPVHVACMDPGKFRHNKAGNIIYRLAK